jgi:CubicO group peptidase (beta-lactamase class C family)
MKNKLLSHERNGKEKLTKLLHLSSLIKSSLMAGLISVSSAQSISKIELNSLTSLSQPSVGQFSVNGDKPQLVLLRSLAKTSGIKDPILSLISEDGKNLLAINDNWSAKKSQADAIEAANTQAGLTQLIRGSKDAALLIRLSPGTYRFNISGKEKGEKLANFDAVVVGGVELNTAQLLPLLGVVRVTKDQGKAPAIMVGKINDKTIQSLADGLVRKDEGKKVKKDSYFQLGSCTKSMTGTLAGMMVEKGKIRWNSSLVEVFPELASAMNAQIKNVTLEQLLSHRGGFDGFLVTSDIATLPVFTGTLTQQRLGLVSFLTSKPSFGPIGQFNYSNASFAIAGAMLEKVDGKPYEELLLNNVMKPLKIQAFFGYPAEFAPAKQKTYGHITFAGVQLIQDPTNELFAPYNFPPYLLNPAGGVSMTSDGFSRYVQMHLRGLRGQNGLLKAQTIAYLHRPYGGSETGYALGWQITKRDNILTSQHNGSLDPYFAQMAIQPSRNLAAMAVASRGEEEGIRTAEQAVMLILGRAIESANGSTTPSENPVNGDEVLGSVQSVNMLSLASRNTPSRVNFTVAGGMPSKLLFRAVGPSLIQNNIKNPSAKTIISIVNRDTNQAIGTNSGWDSDRAKAFSLAQAAIAANVLQFGKGSLDSALIVTLPPGNYIATAVNDDASNKAIRIDVSVLPKLESNPVLALKQEIQNFNETYQSQANTTAVIKDQNIIYSGASGKANIEQNLDATTDTAFLIASISKTVTTVAAMQLVEKGQLNLDANINIYLPFAISNPNFATKAITCRQLMTHTSSIVDTQFDKISDGLLSSGADSPIPLSDLIQQLYQPNGSLYSTMTFAKKAPGTEFSYSNFGMTLLGYIVERISNQPFDQYCQQNIFRPLGMNHTTWRLAQASTRPLAVPYSLFDVSYTNYTFADYPDGGLFTSVNDLSIFMRAMMNGGLFNGKRILAANTVSQMLRIAFPKIKGAENQGLGFNRYTLPTGEVVWGHAGGDIGVNTFMYFNLENKVGAISFLNKDLVDPTVQFDLAQTLFSWGLSQP